MKENPFKKYETYLYKEGVIENINIEAFEKTEEVFEIFKSLYDQGCGSIREEGNLISIHSGGWSENEYLIDEFKKTIFWYKHHKITANGGHYYFNTDTSKDKDWKIVKE